MKDSATSASAMGRFAAEMLTQPENFEALFDLPGRWIDAVHDQQPPKAITLDMDSSEGIDGVGGPDLRHRNVPC